MENLAVVCADVGSVSKGNFGWWSASQHAGKDLSSLSAFVAQVLNAGLKVALGFECPLYVLLREDEAALTRARPGEGNRAWCAGAGSGALATGLVQVAWALQKIRNELERPAPVYLDWLAFEQAERGLFLWEAFVSAEGKATLLTPDSDQHVADARAGVLAFVDAQPHLSTSKIIRDDLGPVHSLIGAALLRTGWSTDLELLAQPCLVLKAMQPVPLFAKHE